MVFPMENIWKHLLILGTNIFLLISFVTHVIDKWKQDVLLRSFSILKNGSTVTSFDISVGFRFLMERWFDRMTKRWGI